MPESMRRAGARGPVPRLARVARLSAAARPVAALALVSCAACASAQSGASRKPAGGGDDARIGLRAGQRDAGAAAHNLEHIANVPRPDAFADPLDPGSILFANSDMAFRGNLLFLGNFHGFQIFDISDPASPRLRTSIVCPGGQGDLSVHGDLLFMSVEMPNGRLDCGAGALTPQPSPGRFLGVRIFDISDIDSPKKVGAVQTCRGSHTHTLVTDPSDPENVYVYVSGTSDVRPASELPGCSGLPPDRDPQTALFRIEVIRVPLAAPQNATVVNAPRVFANPATGEIAGLWPGGSHGPGTQTTSGTDQCHDITVHPELGLAAGACSGNGILLNIRDVTEPVRTDEVVDPNFAYWHSATFSNGGDKVLFTDEWGGGTAARCRSSDPREWGADAIFSLENGEMRLRGYYKLPAPQTAAENCVAHNGSLVPVPGRDIMVQAWYQGGISVFDFTDPANPYEIAYFDRGPLDAGQLILGGFWSAYWYNGAIYGSEMTRGLDVLRLVPSEHLSENEIEAAKLVRLERFNPQTQHRFTWPARFVVARAYLDQLRRAGRVAPDRLARIGQELDAAEAIQDPARRRTALAQIASNLGQLGASGEDGDRVEALAEVVRGIAQRLE